MELYLQFGYGMMDLSQELFELWGGGTAILSPRDLTPSQLPKIGEKLRNLNGRVLIDPQFYLPRADHHRLISHTYWPDNYDTTAFDDSQSGRMHHDLLALNDDVGTSQIIIPGERAEVVDDLWLTSQRRFLDLAIQTIAEELIIQTICLSSDAIRDNAQIGTLMDEIETRPVGCYYLVIERPGNAYIVDDPQWLANVLDLVAGIRKLGSKVIMGYSNHQQLILACAGTNAIASGTWMNVRSFFPDKFRQAHEEETKRRATWYYCPQALSEYTLSFLNIASRLGVVNEMYSDPPTQYSQSLFLAPQPSASGWGERDAFCHYLTALNYQVQNSTQPTYEETINYHKQQLAQAEHILTFLHENDITGQARDFMEGLPASRAALTLLDRIHGPFLRRKWGEISS